MGLDAWLARMRAASARGETLVDLAAVAAWLQQRTPLWQARGLTVMVGPVTRGLPKNSLRLILDGPSFASELIVWDSGEWEFMNGRLTDEQVHTSEYDPASSTEEVLRKLERALAVIETMAP